MQASFTQIRLAQARPDEASALQVRSVQHGVREVCICQLRLMEISTVPSEADPVISTSAIALRYRNTRDYNRESRGRLTSG